MKQPLYDARGVKNGNVKLSESQVREIRKLLKEGAIQDRLAEKYGVSDMAISKIKTGQTWAFLK